MKRKIQNVHIQEKCDEWLSTRNRKKVRIDEKFTKRSHVPRVSRSGSSLWKLTQNSQPPPQLKTFTKQSSLLSFFQLPDIKNPDVENTEERKKFKTIEIVANNTNILTDTITSPRLPLSDCTSKTVNKSGETTADGLNKSKASNTLDQETDSLISKTSPNHSLKSVKNLNDSLLSKNSLNDSMISKTRMKDTLISKTDVNDLSRIILNNSSMAESDLKHYKTPFSTNLKLGESEHIVGDDAGINCINKNNKNGGDDNNEDANKENVDPNCKKENKKKYSEHKDPCRQIENKVRETLFHVDNANSENSLCDVAKGNQNTERSELSFDKTCSESLTFSDPSTEEYVRVSKQYVSVMCSHGGTPSFGEENTTEEDFSEIVVEEPKLKIISKNVLDSNTERMTTSASPVTTFDIEDTISFTDIASENIIQPFVTTSTGYPSFGNSSELDNTITFTEYSQ